MKIYYFFIAFLLGISACIEPYEPEVGAYDSTLVVDGILTDGATPFKIQLSRSFPYADDISPAISAAQVFIETEQGDKISLTETTPGVYENDPNIFKGEGGKSYRLLITTPEGNQFESDWQQLKTSPSFDLAVAYQEQMNSNNESIFGAQINLSTADGGNNTRFYRWEFEETYEYLLSDPPRISAKLRNNRIDEIVNIPPDDFEGFTCWKTEGSNNILIATTADLTQDVIQNFPLHYIDGSTSRLYRRYSILVKQYALSEDYFDYIKKVEAVNETTGSLFDPIPSEFFGNITSSDGQDLPVLGYFTAAGISENRIFINRDELPVGLRGLYGPFCEKDTLDLNSRTLYNKISRENKVLYDYQYSLIGGIIIGYIITEPPCAKCGATEATNVRPDFW